MLFLLATLAHAGEVTRIADGSWLGAATYDLNGNFTQPANLWVDISAQNVGYGKHVGIRWTDDNWATWHDAEAWYEGSLGGGREQWGVDIVPMGTWAISGDKSKYHQWDGDWIFADAVTIEYAIWMSYGGATWWDGNYAVSLAHP